MIQQTTTPNKKEILFDLAHHIDSLEKIESDLFLKGLNRDKIQFAIDSGIDLMTILAGAKEIQPQHELAIVVFHQILKQAIVVAEIRIQQNMLVN